GNIYTANADGSEPRLLLSNVRLTSFHSWGGLAKAATAQGTNVTTQSGGTSVMFSNVTTPGETAVIPLPALGPALPQGYFNVIGKVVDENGMPLNDAKVALSGDSQAATVTDINGQFAFPNLQANGNYTIGVAANGHIFDPPTMDLAQITKVADLLFVGVTPQIP